MAAADVLHSGHVLVAWKEPSFAATTDPDSDLSDGVGNANSFTEGTLLELAEPGLGCMPTHPDPIRTRGQSDRQWSPRHRAGRKGANLNIPVRLTAGNTELAGTDVPSGGRLSMLVDAGFGAPLTPAERKTVSAGGSLFACTVAAIGDYQRGLVVCVEDTTAPGATIKSVRIVTNVVANTFSLNRNMAFSSAIGDVIRPLETWVPHLRVTDKPTLRIKRRSRNVSPLEGSAMDFRGCGGVGIIEIPDVGLEPIFRFTGQADNWVYSTPENPNLVVAINNDMTPLLLDSVFYLGGVALEAARVRIDPRLSLAPRPATSGTHGRSGWTTTASLDGVLWTVDVRWDSAYLDAWDNETEYQAEFHHGANSLGTTASGSDHSYFYHYSPAVQVMSIEEVSEGGITYMRLTLEGRRPASGTDGASVSLAFMEPYYFAAAGKTT